MPTIYGQTLETTDTKAALKVRPNQNQKEDDSRATGKICEPGTAMTIEHFFFQIIDPFRRQLYT